MKIRRRTILLSVLLILFVLFNAGLYMLCGMLFHTCAVWMALFLLECILIISFLMVNRCIAATGWFKSIHADYDHERYPDNIWYRKHYERNYDLVNLGSFAAKFAFDYSDSDIKAMNWSSGVQTLIDDYKIVQNFHSILKENGTVIITIMPFTSINKRTGIMESFKFHNTFSGELTMPEHRKKCHFLERFPIFFGRNAFKAFMKQIIGRDTVSPDGNNVDTNPMTDEQLMADAAARVASWKKEFSIESMEDDLTDENQEGRKIRIRIMRELIDFLLEREYRPVWVIPPVSEYLAIYFSDQFKEKYIYDYLKQVDRNVPLLDYLDARDFQDKDLYFNSYFLNQQGAKRFTRLVLADLKKLERL